MPGQEKRRTGREHGKRRADGPGRDRKTGSPGLLACVPHQHGGDSLSTHGLAGIQKGRLSLVVSTYAGLANHRQVALFAHLLSAYSRSIRCRADKPGHDGARFFLVRPARARHFDPPDRTRRIERSLEPYEVPAFVRFEGPLYATGPVWRHAPEQRGEELEPAPQPGFENVVDRGFREVADQHLVLA